VQQAKAHCTDGGGPSQERNSVPYGLRPVAPSYWNALWAPKGTPKNIVAKLNPASVEALADPYTRKRLEDLAQENLTPDQPTPEALGALQKAERRWPTRRPTAHNSWTQY
jgi:hypothetical protein